jgi:site-specific DNA-methyltransferase (adenine-specific)
LSQARELLGGGLDLRRGNCLDILPLIPARTVAMVLCDLPYGSTECQWDHKIALEPLWREWRRVLKPRGAVVLFADSRYCQELRAAAPSAWFRYKWIWDKRGASGWLNARRLPMLAHEEVLVFGRQVRYFPQGLRPCRRRYRAAPTSDVYHGGRQPHVQQWTGYPTSLLRFPREKGALPAQKPVALCEYLVRTYTRRGEVVLDSAMGTGSTGVAAVQAGRRFIGMELDEGRFGLAKGRIEAASALRGK